MLFIPCLRVGESVETAATSRSEEGNNCGRWRKFSESERLGKNY
jgi:hypothetical protein